MGRVRRLLCSTRACALLVLPPRALAASLHASPALPSRAPLPQRSPPQRLAQALLAPLAAEERRTACVLPPSPTYSRAHLPRRGHCKETQPHTHRSVAPALLRVSAAGRAHGDAASRGAAPLRPRALGAVGCAAKLSLVARKADQRLAGRPRPPSLGWLVQYAKEPQFLRVRPPCSAILQADCWGS